MLTFKISRDSRGWGHSVPLYAGCHVEKITAGYKVAGGAFYSLHPWACTEEEKRGISSPPGLEEWRSPLRASKTIAPGWQQAFLIHALSCPHEGSDAKLPQGSLKLCCMKDEHSLYKWTAPFCPGASHPCALHRSSQHCKRSHSMKAVILTWTVQGKM